MTKNITEILRTFDKTEMKRFGDFVKSPYINSIDKLSVLFDVIAKVHPDLNSSKLDDEKIFVKLYPGKKFTQKTLKNLYSEFRKLLNRFLAYEEIERDNDQLYLNLVKALNRKKFFDQAHKLAADKIENSQWCYSNDYWFIHQLLFEDYETFFNREKLNLQQIYDSHYITSKNFLGFFISNFASNSFHLHLSKNITKLEQRDTTIEKFQEFISTERFREFIRDSEFEHTEEVRIYYELFYYMVNDFTEEDYIKLKKYLIKSTGKLSKAIQLHIWDFITSLLGYKLIPKDKKFNKELFILNDFFYNLKIYPDDSLPELATSTLQNIFTNAVIVGEYEWAEKFLNEYINYIPAHLKEDEYNYNMGILKFKLNKFDESLELLSKTILSNIYKNLNVKFYTIMNLIELRNYGIAETLLKSLRQFYNTNKNIPEFAGSLVKDSLKYLGEIIKCEETGSEINYSIYKEASGKQRYYHKKYILEKMKQKLHKNLQPKK